MAVRREFDVDGQRWRADLLQGEEARSRLEGETGGNPVAFGIRFTHVTTGEVRYCREPCTQAFVSVLSIDPAVLLACFRLARGEPAGPSARRFGDASGSGAE